MRDVQTPKYALAGMGNGHDVSWHVVRHADSAFAALVVTYITDDGVVRSSPAQVCTFSHVESAAQLMSHIEDDTAPAYLTGMGYGMALDQAKLAWVSAEDFAACWLNIPAGALGNIDPVVTT